MTGKLEKKDSAFSDTQKNFKESLIKHILDFSVPKIVAITKDRVATEQDLAEVMGDWMKQYKDSDMTRKMLGAENYKEWDSFFDDIINIVLEKVREVKKNETPIDSPPLKSQDLKQKNLF